MAIYTNTDVENLFLLLGFLTIFVEKNVSNETGKGLKETPKY